jgi:hypothetical protein
MFANHVYIRNPLEYLHRFRHYTSIASLVWVNQQNYTQFRLEMGLSMAL